MQTFNEQAVLLGPRKSLVAVVTKATKAGADPERPTIVILNSGIIHRVGANRMTVELSRAYAAAGYTVVRFDLSGIGDSDPRTDSLSPLDGALADIREVLDSLEASRKTSRFILVGLCSGANHSVVYAGSDPRVVGAALLEPTFPPGYLHYVHHYARRLVNRESWSLLARGEHRLIRSLKSRVAAFRDGKGTGAQANGAGSEDAPEDRQPKITDPEVRTFLENAYRRLVEREMPFLVVLTGESWYYRESFLHAFPKVSFGDLVRLEYLEDADHIFTPRAASTKVIRLIVEWTESTMSRRGSSNVSG